MADAYFDTAHSYSETSHLASKILDILKQTECFTMVFVKLVLYMVSFLAVFRPVPQSEKIQEYMLQIASGIRICSESITEIQHVLQLQFHQRILKEIGAK